MENVAPVVLEPDTDVSTQLLAASRSRRFLTCGVGGRQAAIDAEAIRRACLAADHERDPYGLRIADATIVGRLDLRAARVATPLHFAGCTFTEAPVFEGADLHEIVVTDHQHASPGSGSAVGPSHLPGLLANGVRVRRDLVLSGSVITGAHATSVSLSKTSAVWLTEAEIGGRLLAVGTQIHARGDRAIQADRTRVAGDVRLIQGFLATGEVRLLAMQLGGSLDLAAASLSPANGRALDLAEAHLGGSLFILDDPDTRVRPRIRGRIELAGATVQGRLLIRNADLEAPSSGTGLHDYNSEDLNTPAFLLAPRLTVHGGFVVEGETVIRGGLLLHGADLKGGMRMDHMILWNAGDVALDLSQATLGAGLSLQGALIQGTARMNNARVAGPVDLDGVQLDNPRSRQCLAAVGAHVDGDVRLRGVTVNGGSANFRGATLGGVVDAQGATLSNPGDKTLSLHQAHVAGNVRLCTGFSSVGLVVLNRAVIDGRLRCDGAALKWVPASSGPDEHPEPNTRGCAFEAISAVVRTGIDLGWRIRAGAVDLTDARTTYLADDPDTDWPEHTYLSGFDYERFAPRQWDGEHGPSDAATRIRWLARLRPYDRRPWEHLARVLRASGDHAGADEVLIAQRRHARRLRAGYDGRPWRLLLDVLNDATTRYGYRPQRALTILVMLIAAVAVTLTPPLWQDTMRAATGSGGVCTPTGPDPGTARAVCDGKNVRPFDPTLYAIDTVVPIIDLKQRSTWHPSQDLMQWWLNACSILGWAASTVFALALTRIGRPSSS